MKSALFLLITIILTGFARRDDNVEFVCLKTHKASNTCYFNFRVDGGKYHFTDAGCRKAKKKEDLIQKVKDGRVALKRDWKIDCPEAEPGESKP